VPTRRCRSARIRTIRPRSTTNVKRPCLPSVRRPKMGPDVDLEPGRTFESFRVYDLLLDSSERERRTLAQRRMYRTVAPWTAQNR